MLSSKNREKMVPYLFILPFFMMFGVFQMAPLVYGILMSFSKITVAARPMQFVGAYNFTNLFTNPRFYHSLKITGLFTLIQGSLCLLIGLALALILNIKLRGTVFFRMVYFLPVVLSLAVSAMIWRLMLDDKIGFINLALRVFGFSGNYKWLTSSRLILPSIILVSTWRWFGFIMIILLAGLQNIPLELYDAAKIDGASSFKIIWHITLPLLFPIIFFCMIISAIGSMKVFEEPFILAGISSGGPGDNALSTAVYLYISAFTYFKLGYSAAIACILILLIMGITIFQIRLLGRRAGM